MISPQQQPEANPPELPKDTQQQSEKDQPHKYNHIKNWIRITIVYIAVIAFVIGAKNYLYNQIVIPSIIGLGIAIIATFLPFLTNIPSKKSWNQPPGWLIKCTYILIIIIGTPMFIISFFLPPLSVQPVTYVPTSTPAPTPIPSPTPVPTAVVTPTQTSLQSQGTVYINTSYKWEATPNTATCLWDGENTLHTIKSQNGQDSMYCTHHLDQPLENTFAYEAKVITTIGKGTGAGIAFIDKTSGQIYTFAINYEAQYYLLTRGNIILGQGQVTVNSQSFKLKAVVCKGNLSLFIDGKQLVGEWNDISGTQVIGIMGSDTQQRSVDVAFQGGTVWTQPVECPI